MKKTLIVIDMQNDFIYEPFGTKEAVEIIPNVKKKINEYLQNGDEIIFTQDTHYDDYLKTMEGKNLPITHCIKDTHGWKIPAELDLPECEHINKESFGYANWDLLESEENGIHHFYNRHFNEIEIIGLCTDICVVSNALILKALYPEVQITVDVSCCAGTTPENHKAAINTMKCCQINIIGEI